MKAWLSDTVGGPETLRLGETSPREPSEGEVRIAVRACGLNFPDLLHLRDAYQLKLPRPLVPGSEVAGIVDSVGPKVDKWKVGDRVIAVCDSGGLGQLAVVKAANCFTLPPDMPFETGAALIFTYATSHYALSQRGLLKSGERVLVLGAGGGIGLAMTELAAAHGAEVTAAASEEAKLTLARKKGAKAGLLYPREVRPEDGKAVAEKFKEAAGRGGFDVIVDPVGGAYAEPALRSINWEGRYLVVGFAAGIPKPALNLVLLKGCSIVGVDWYGFGRRDPEGRERSVAELFELVRSGAVDPAPSEILDFDAAAEALAHVDRRTSAGKIVIRVPQ